MIEEFLNFTCFFFFKQLKTTQIYYLVISINQKSRPIVFQLDSLHRISKDQNQCISCLGSGEESTFKFIQIIGRILFLVVPGLRSRPCSIFNASSGLLSPSEA